MPNAPDTAAARAPRRFRPGAWPTLAMLAAVAVCVAAGNWQQRRMHEQGSAARSSCDAAQRMAPVALAALPDAADWTSLRYRAVVAAGDYRAARADPDRQPGARRPRRLRRRDAARARPTAASCSSTAAGLRGRDARRVARRAAARRRRHGRGADRRSGRRLSRAASPTRAAGAVWQNLDPARFAAATGVTVLPVVIEQTAAPVPDDGLVRDWTAPDFGIDKHRIYMVQWYAFAALAIALWLVSTSPLAATRPCLMPVDARTEPRRARVRQRPAQAAADRAICIAPVLASYAFYYLSPRGASVNYGTLLPTAPGAGARRDAQRRRALPPGRPARPVGAAGRCGAALRCGVRAPPLRDAAGAHDAGQGAGARRAGAGCVPMATAPDPALRRAASGARRRARSAKRRALRCRRGADAIYLVDPLGNLVLRYGADPDIKGIGKDLTRLLKASGIG